MEEENYFEKNKNTLCFILFIVIIVVIIFYFNRYEHFDIPVGNNYPFINTGSSNWTGTSTKPIPKINLTMTLSKSDNATIDSFKKLCTDAKGTYVNPVSTGSNQTLTCNNANQYIKNGSNCINLNAVGTEKNIAYRDYVCDNGSSRENIIKQKNTNNQTQCKKFGGKWNYNTGKCEKYLKSQYDDSSATCIKPSWV